MLWSAGAADNPPTEAVPTPPGCQRLHSTPQGSQRLLTPRGRQRLLAASASTGRRLELAELAEKVRLLQAAHRPTLPRCPTGLQKLDAALGGGFARGCLHELLASTPGAPARSLALWAAVQAANHSPDAHNAATLSPMSESVEVAAGWHGRLGRENATTNPNTYKWVFYIDTTGDFYPPGAARLGLSLERLLILRTPRTTDALWVCEQALRCKAIAAVILLIQTLDAYVSRRLQLAAETGGGLGFLLRNDSRAGHTFAATRLRLDPLSNKNPTPRIARDGEPVFRGGICATHRMRVTLLKLRDGRPAEPFELTLPHPAARETIPRDLRTHSPSHPPSPSAASAS